MIYLQLCAFTDFTSFINRVIACATGRARINKRLANEATSTQTPSVIAGETWQNVADRGGIVRIWPLSLTRFARANDAAMHLVACVAGAIRRLARQEETR